MKNLTVLVDMDSTFVDLLNPWLQAIHADHGVLARPEDITSWSLHRCPPLDRLPAGAVYDYLHREGFFRRLPALRGALGCMKALVDAGHDVVVVSSPSGPVSAKEKFEWLEEHLPWFPRNQVMLANKKTLVRGDVLVDDHPDTLVAYKKAWPDALAVGIEYPYNRHLAAGSPRAWRGETPAVFPDYLEPEKAWKSIHDVVTFRARGVI